MSASYTLHLPAAAVPGDERSLDRAELVRDGFSWGALISPTLWLLVHRHWITAIVVTALTAALLVGLWAAGVSTLAIVAVDLLIHLLVAIEGPSLRRLAYGLRRRPMRDVVVAASLAEAESKMFGRWLGEGAAPAPCPAFVVRPPPAGRAAPEPVIGLFPDAESRRP